MTKLPPNFLYGASTAAFQIEGAWNADGKGESIWDRFCRTSGRVANGDTGDVACDHYHRFEEDLDLVAGAGLKAYRFSINWTRVLPDGVGRVNEAGLQFYERIVDGCLSRGIEPWPCFYHWDYSQALQERGGWATRDSVSWYLELVEVIVRRLSDRVSRWVMFNEPSVFTAIGHLVGTHAPGIRDQFIYGAAVHHVSLATAEGIRLVRSLAPAAQVGTVLAINQMEAASDSEADLATTRRIDAVANKAFLDPLFKGVYPEAILAMVEPAIQPGDTDKLAERVDFLGVNHYTRTRISADTSVSTADGATAGAGLSMVAPPPGTPVTAMGWEIRPSGIYEAISRVARDYTSAPIYITENGGAFEDAVGSDGRVHDRDRIALLDGYLREVARACADGFDVRGYLVWSLLDNFEWSHGYAKRFGLVHVDYATQQRTPKDSYHWYSQLARTGEWPAS